MVHVDETPVARLDPGADEAKKRGRTSGLCARRSKRAGSIIVLRGGDQRGHGCWVPASFGPVTVIVARQFRTLAASAARRCIAASTHQRINAMIAPSDFSCAWTSMASLLDREVTTRSIVREGGRLTVRLGRTIGGAVARKQDAGNNA